VGEVGWIRTYQAFGLLSDDIKNLQFTTTEGTTMTTAIIGVGNIGGTLARHLVSGGESVVLAAKDASHPQALASELGPLAGAASVQDAIGAADTVILAIPLDTLKELVPQNAHLLKDKVVVDPSSPIGLDDKGQLRRTLPETQSAGGLVSAMLPPDAHYVKAFGSLAAPTLAAGRHHEPTGVLFYATDDERAAAEVERLMRAAGFDPLKAGGVADAGRIEAPTGDLFSSDLVDVDRARAAIAAR
jgi:predicted dinucleotide-binding enzyme